MGKIFISYSHDSEEHVERVLTLSNRLRNDGIESILDQYFEENPPPEGWPHWMERNVDEADFVIIVCTETYYRRFIDKEEKGKGLGVKWESILTTNHIYQADSKNKRFVPVLFKKSDDRFIPVPLKGVSYYCADTVEGYEKLYRRLTGQPSTEMPELGKLILLPPKNINLKHLEYNITEVDQTIEETVPDLKMKISQQP